MKKLYDVMGLILAVTLATILVKSVMDNPTVFVDIEGKCYKVETPKGPGTCEDLPKRYDLVYGNPKMEIE